MPTISADVQTKGMDITLSCCASFGASFLLMNSSRASGASVLAGRPGDSSKYAGMR